MLQGIPALPGQTGTVSGVVRTSIGTPAAGIRVSAMVPPDVATDLASAASFSALAQTDEEGRYRLEGIPVGRYYIVAGRVDLPTFYPGTADMTKARIFSIAPGGAVSGIDFVMMDTSIRSLSARTDDAAQLAAYLGQLQQVRGVAFSMPTQVRLEPGAKLPFFVSDAFTMVRFTDAASGVQKTQAIKDSFAVSLSLLGTNPEFRVDVLNLPEGYAVKSITYGTDDVTRGTLKVPPDLVPRPTILTVNGVTQVAVASVAPPGQSVPELTITLGTVPVSPAPGAIVTGSVKDGEARSIYLSGMPGIFFSDGTFEFRGVPPGRHSIAAIGISTAPSVGASIVIGDRNMDGVVLDPIAALPLDVRQATAPGPAGSHSPGTVLPLVSVRGRILEEASGTPIEEGSVRLIGRDAAVAPVGAGGEFEFTRLLPGSYDLEVRIFGHSNVLQHIVVSEDDIRVDVKTLRLY